MQYAGKKSVLRLKSYVPQFMLVLAGACLAFACSRFGAPPGSGTHAAAGDKETDFHAPNSIQAIPGHAHNDYAHARPLQEALDQGFTSVEVDVHLVDGLLYVSHDHPETLTPSSRLDSLYLAPLKAHVHANDGQVYSGYQGPFFLMLDFKTAAGPTYKALKTVLQPYHAMLSPVVDGEVQNGPVKLFISGNRPIDKILEDNPQWAAIDGRPADLERNIPATLMPVVSDHYNHVLQWNGKGEIQAAQKARLKALVRATHAQDKMLRLWAAPDFPASWRFLLNSGVDLINTDRLQDFRHFYLRYEQKQP